jgi:tight adherence protein B
MSSNIAALLAVVCITTAIFFFFKNTYNTLLNSFFRKFWFQAEKCYINFELMFLDEKFPMVKCRILIISSMFGCACFLGYLCRSAPSYVPLVTIVIGVVLGWVLPGFITSYLHNRYVYKFDAQLLDGLGLVANGLRSGLSLQQSMGLVSKEMLPPISQEFNLLITEYNYGKTLDEAYERMAKRVPSLDLGITVEAILVLRSTGANLVETFDIIIDTVRERKKVEGKIRSMTAMGVFQGFLLGAMPFVLMKGLHMINPEYMNPLFTTTIGWVMIGIVVLLVVLGGLAIKSIVTIDV